MKKLLDKFNLLNINGFSFYEELSSGNMSSAAIYSSKNGEKRIVKFLLYPRNSMELDRFKKEVEAMEKISTFYNDTNIPKLFSQVEKVADTEIYYFIMSFAAGIPISKFIKENGQKLSKDQVLKIITKEYICQN